MNYVKQLKSISKATGWSQEQLASELGVSFVTLNSWINGKSQPRKNALQNIEDLYSDTLGSDSIDYSKLGSMKKTASRLELKSTDLIDNDNLLDKLTLHFTYHTNTIEGSTMTLSDVEDVIYKDKVLSNRTAIEQAEARNHKATLHWLIDEINSAKSNFTITEKLIKDIHLRLMNGIISDAGKYRKHSVRIMGSNVALSNWQSIERDVFDFVDSGSEEGFIASLAMSHAQFEKIHPFSDGNGRTGRLLMLAQALSCNTMVPLVANERKYAYYKYLELAQTKGDHRPLEMFIAQSMIFADQLLSSR